MVLNKRRVLYFLDTFLNYSLPHILASIVCEYIINMVITIIQKWHKQFWVSFIYFSLNHNEDNALLENFRIMRMKKIYIIA